MAASFLGAVLAFFAYPSWCAVTLAGGAPAEVRVLGPALISVAPDLPDLELALVPASPSVLLAADAPAFPLTVAPLASAPLLETASMPAARPEPTPAEGPIAGEPAREQAHPAREALSMPMDELQGQLRDGNDGGELSGAAEEDFMKRLGAGWRRNSFQGEDGAEIRYSLRPGEGPVVVLVHGRSLGSESFARWADAFPGRALMLLERRGYNGSQPGELDLGKVHRLNSSDIDRAIDVARELGGGRKPGVVTYSLSAMLLPRLDPARVAWVALLNPGVYGMLGLMPAGVALSAYALLGCQLNSFWNPFAASGAHASAGMMVEDAIRRLREAAGAGSAELGRHLIALLKDRVRSPRWRELLVKESLWASLGAKPAGYLAAKVPVFLGLSEDDELVPQAAFQRLAEELRETSRLVRVERRPGSHLSFIFEPGLIVPALEEFDKDVHQGGAP